MKRELCDIQHILQSNYPIVGAVIYPNGIEIRREQKTPLQSDWRPDSNKVTRLSKCSRSRLAFLVNTTMIEFKSILTLTYSNIPQDGKEVKANLNTFLTKLRYHFSPISYVWFLEFQKRGAPHYHLLLSIPVDDVSRETMARLWAKIIHSDMKDYAKIWNVHKHPKTWENVKEEAGAKRYALKYALKTYQKTVPKQYQDVGRFWGNSRDVKAEGGIEIDITEDEMREWIEAHNPEINDRLSVILPKFIFRGEQKVDKT